MAQVMVTVNGRAYTLQCGDGEEEHLSELGGLLDSEVERIKRAVGQVGDVRLLVMAGLVIADKLSESSRRIDDLEVQVRRLQENQNGARRRAEDLEGSVVKRLDEAARRLEALTRDTGSPAG
jgi:cell division protein ZapA